MPTYSFRCARGDVFDVLIPMLALRSTWTCPTCSQPSTRVYGAPALARLGSTLHRAADLAASSAERPHVVRRPVAAESPGNAAGRTPATRRSRYPALPRP